MGTTASSTAQRKSKEHEDIRYLGNRYPFGDAELKRLYRCYYLLRACPNRTSFILDWGIHCASQVEKKTSTFTREENQERNDYIKGIEAQILPENFGERLERVAFLPAHYSQQQYMKSSEKDAAKPSLSSPPPSTTEAYVSSSTQKSNSSCSGCFLPFSKQDVVSPEERMQLIEATLAASQTDDMEGLEAFLEGVANCGRRGVRNALGVLFDCCAATCKEKDSANATELLDLGYRIAVAGAFLENASTDNIEMYLPEASNHFGLKALTNSLLEFAKKQRSSPYSYGGETNTSNLDENTVTRMEFTSWAESTAPLLSSALSTLTHAIFFPDKPYPPSRTAFKFPTLHKTSSFFEAPTSPLLFSFACMSSSLGGMWHRLFTSDSDGLSFNRLQLALLGYGGPTLLVVRETNNGGVFGAFTASSWKETRDFYGNSDCFLFQLYPQTAVYHPSGNGTNYMYCNSNARSKGYDGLAHGIGFGGTADQPRLFIDESLDNCVALSADMTFEYGSLLPTPPKTDDEFYSGNAKKRFDIDALEVWGVGGNEVVAAALGARQAQREVTAANIQKARKVDKAAFLEDFQTGLIESKAFKHRDQIRGRADAAIDDRHKNGYVYEK